VGYDLPVLGFGCVLMAGHTINGRYDSSTGKIKFGSGDCSTPLSCMGGTVLDACFDTATGQVKLIVSNADYEECNDTYYACFNSTTGLFSVNIPYSNCCCDWNDTDCSYCADDDEPAYVDVVISGITACSCGVGAGISGSSETLNWGVNGSYIVPIYGARACDWLGNDISGTFGTWRNYTDETDCTGSYNDEDWDELDIFIRKTASDSMIVEVSVREIGIGSDRLAFENQAAGIDSKCIDSEVSSTLGSSDCWTLSGGKRVVAYGGTVTISDKCQYNP